MGHLEATDGDSCTDPYLLRTLFCCRPLEISNEGANLHMPMKYEVLCIVGIHLGHWFPHGALVSAILPSHILNIDVEYKC